MNDFMNRVRQDSSEFEALGILRRRKLEEKLHVKIKTNIPFNNKTRQLWYYKHQGETYELMLDTKAGFLVHRHDKDSTSKWNIKHKHAELLIP